MRLGITTFPHPPGTNQYLVLAHGLNMARQLGVQVLNCAAPAGSPDDLARLREQLEAAGLELEPTCGANYCSDGEEAKRVVARVSTALQVASQLGCPRLRTMAARATNRFSTRPPLDEQLGMIESNLREVVAVAEMLGITLALENHCDYRGLEIAELVRRVGSSRLGAALDTGNAYTVFEDPLDAAAALAPLSVTTHLKDLRIAPLDLPGMVPWVPIGCALGEGNVDLPSVVELLARQAPDPRSLPLVVEVNWAPAGQDEGDLIVRSVRYLRDRFSAYL